MHSTKSRWATSAPPMLAIAGALMLAGYGHTAQAFTTIPTTCNYCSHVTDSVTNHNDGTWTYDFTVHNDTSSVNYGSDDGIVSQNIVDWELPYFADAGINNIYSPSGWTYAIETIGTPNNSSGWDGVAAWQTPGDPMYKGPASPFTTATQVLHWYIDDASSIEPQASLGGFGFDSAYGSIAAPYQASWDDTVIRTGDPAFPNASFNIPASPSAVPLPAPLLLFMSALVPWFGLSRRNRK